MESRSMWPQLPTPFHVTTELHSLGSCLHNRMRAGFIPTLTHAHARTHMFTHRQGHKLGACSRIWLCAGEGGRLLCRVMGRLLAVARRPDCYFTFPLKSRMWRWRCGEAVVRQVEQGRVVGLGCRRGVAYPVGGGHSLVGSGGLLVTRRYKV